MINKKNLLVIGPTDDYFRKLLSLEINVSILTEKNRVSEFQKKNAHEIIVLQFTDIKAILISISDIHEKNCFDAVVSFTEFGMEPAAIISSALQIPGPPLRCSLISRDKLRTRQAMKGTLADSVNFRQVDSEDDFLDFIKVNGYPCVLKPRFSTGSCQVEILNSAIDFIEKDLSGFIVEEYVAGKEYSCETFSINGVHTLVAVTEKILGGISGVVEVGHKIIPGKENDEKVTSFLKCILDNIEMHDGVGHIEVKENDGQLHLIECHNRPGGDRIWQLSEISTGFDLVSSYALSLLNEADIVPVIHDRQCASITYFQFPPGKVKSFEHSLNTSPDWLEWYEWTIDVGTILEPLKDSFHRHGGFIISALDSDSLNTRISHILSSTGVDICPP